MYDYSEVLALLDRSDRFHDDIVEAFSKMTEEGAIAESTSAQILSLLKRTFASYNPSPMIVELDLDGNITYANKHFVERSKYPHDELMGQNINIFKNSHNPTGIYQDIWNHMEDKKAWLGELRNSAADYSSYWIETCICPVLGDDGEIIKYWSLSYDITDRVAVRLELESKNEELEDSMKYAKRIQKTILPEKSTMNKALEDFFVIWKAKDIVSGDFYWFTSTIDKVFIAAVDCTGHGVPGAFMSLIGYNLLNQIVIQRRIHTPGLILTELHKGVRAALKQDAQDSKSRDGMDLSLVAMDRFDNRVQFAGAHNSLYWWCEAEQELKRVRADKMAIGGEQMEDERIFTNHEIYVEDGDCIYLFSDGFVDQFGGPDDKKFGTKRLKNLIRKHHEEPMKVQRAKFNIEWRDWIQDDEQIDDVTLIGIKFSGDDEEKKLTSKKGE